MGLGSASTIFKTADLPSEILHSISLYLDWQDACAFRFVCKAFADVGARRVFQDAELQVWRERSSLERLMEISNHHTIRFGIRRVHIDLEGIPFGRPWRNFKRFLDVVRNCSREPDKSHRGLCKHIGDGSLSQDDLTEAWHEAQAAREYQRHVFLDGSLRDMLCQSISTFSNLRELSIAAHDRGPEPYRERKPPYQKLCTEISVTREARVGDLAFEWLLLTLQHTNVKLNCLELDHLGWHLFNGTTITMPNTPMMAPLRSITQLRLRLNICDRRKRKAEAAKCAAAFRNGGLRRVTTAMKCLENFEFACEAFDYAPDMEDRIWGTCFNDLLDADQHWPHFRRLVLKKIELNANSFLSFARNHAASFKILELNFLGLDASWPVFLEEVPEILALEQAALTGSLYGKLPLERRTSGRVTELFCVSAPPYEDEDFYRMQDFLLRKTEHCPLNYNFDLYRND